MNIFLNKHLHISKKVCNFALRNLIKNFEF